MQCKICRHKGVGSLGDRRELQEDVDMENTHNEESELMKWFNRGHIDEVIEDFLSGIDYNSDREGDYHK